MKYGLDVATTGEWSDPQRLLELARAAEASGWDGFFVWDIFLPEDDAEPVADPWIALAAIGTVTTRMRIGAMVTPFPRRHPWDVARSLVTLDISRGVALSLARASGGGRTSSSAWVSNLIWPAGSRTSRKGWPSSAGSGPAMG